MDFTALGFQVSFTHNEGKNKKPDKILKNQALGSLKFSISSDAIPVKLKPPS